jgi:hypothetical protein
VCCDPTSLHQAQPGCRPLYQETIAMVGDGIIDYGVACRRRSEKKESVVKFRRCVNSGSRRREKGDNSGLASGIPGRYNSLDAVTRFGSD